MPLIEWNQDNTKYVLTFLPLSGLITGAAEAGWLVAAQYLGIHAPLFAAVACGIPLLIHGGIHLDGLADTADACASRTSPEKRREILADPHTGAFGAGAVVIYEVILFGLFCEIFELTAHNRQNGKDVLVLVLVSFIVPMILVQIASVSLSPSGSQGILYSLISAADNRLNIITAVEVAALCTAITGIVRMNAVGIFGIAAFLVYLYFRNLTVKQFGGISGDLCGWLIKISEAVMLAAVLIVLISPEFSVEVFR